MHVFVGSEEVTVGFSDLLLTNHISEFNTTILLRFLYTQCTVNE